MKFFRMITLLLLFGFIVPSHVYAKKEINTGFLNNIALEKYDPVAYFILKRPVKGSKKYVSAQ